MKSTIISIALLLGILLVPSCSDVITKPEEPKAMYVQTNSAGSYDPIPIGDRPNRDSVKKDTTEKKKDTTSGRKDTTSRLRPTIFNDLLVRLNVGPDQRAIVERLLSEYRSCTENCVKPLKAAEAEILTKARLQEAEIKKAVESGTISKSQARQRLADLKANVNKALKELPIRKSVQDCIKSCDTSFVNRLEQILNPNQKEILKAWLATRAGRGQTGKKDSIGVKPRG